jgi:hydrogenase maturation factor
LDADVSYDAIPLHPFTRRAAEALGFDPLRLVASGSMIAAVPADRAALVESAFLDASIEIARVGVMKALADGGAPCRHPALSAEPGEELWPLLKRGRGLV